MVTVETEVERTNDVTTVRVVLTNTHSTPQTVRLQTTLEGPVWPPQRNGVVDPRWDVDDGVWEATIRPGRSRGVGFASPVTDPAPQADSLVEIVSSERQRQDEADCGRPTPMVLADLDDWSPTSEVLEREP
ncbi:hypothetical protein [Natronoglomus mannanivorans]|uniref:Uncharacterized protein n=1 Tax=Natronoglomus mannanivorans TaxID=2979990 RepID=A0AAP3E1H5_9EURY|nr:hypothetical protein [Halobacteria archaeon AArc-xg1-1]